jgi:hypothetical protein
LPEIMAHRRRCFEGGESVRVPVKANAVAGRVASNIRQTGMSAIDDVRVDGMSMAILKDKETSTDVDYFFVADAWCADPRYKSRHMLVGQRRGLLRFDKETLEAMLLYPMAGDAKDKRFTKAVGKVLSERQASGAWPEKTQYVAG